MSQLKKQYCLYRKFFVSILIITILFSTPVLVCAHPGGTDSNGGHYDRSTGEYHYHHGYSAHQHEDGYCPYNYHDNTKNSSSYAINNESIWIFALFFVTTIILFIFIAFCIELYKNKKEIKRKETYVIPLKNQLDEIRQRENKIRIQITETASKGTNQIEKREEQLSKLIEETIHNKLEQVKARESNIDILYSKVKIYHEKEYCEYFIGKGNDEKLAGFPDGIKVIDGKIVDTEYSWEKYGRFTFYHNTKGGKIHLSEWCGGNNCVPYHLLYDNTILKEYDLCKKCRDFSFPEKIKFYANTNKWYNNYLKIQELKEKYNIKQVE